MAGDVTVSGKPAQFALGGAGAGGAGSGLLEGVQLTWMGAQAAAPDAGGEPGGGAGFAGGAGELGGAGVVGGGAEGEPEGALGCDGVGMACATWLALPQAASSATNDASAARQQSLAWFMGFLSTDEAELRPVACGAQTIES